MDIGCGVYINQPSTYMYPKTPFQYAVKKYGTQSFKIEILFIYDTEKEAYKKEEEIVNIDFIKQDHVYNACLGGISGKPYKTLYQFDLQGKLVKVWTLSKEAYEFYNIPIEKFEYAIHDKHPLVDSFWSTSPNIDVTEYSTKAWGSPEVTYLYTKNGKLVMGYEEAIVKDFRNVAKAIYDMGLISGVTVAQDPIKLEVFLKNKEKLEDGTY